MAYEAHLTYNKLALCFDMTPYNFLVKVGWKPLALLVNVEQLMLTKHVSLEEYRVVKYYLQTYYAGVFTRYKLEQEIQPLRRVADYHEYIEQHLKIDLNRVALCHLELMRGDYHIAKNLIDDSHVWITRRFHLDKGMQYDHYYVLEESKKPFEGLYVKEHKEYVLEDTNIELDGKWGH